jgi:glutathione synthase/RimK-type ligase-like ATP-grasp enzyme
MMRMLFGGSQSEAPSVLSKASPQTPQDKPATLLVIQMDAYDWPAIFKDFRLRDGRGINVIQTGWNELQVHADTYSSARLCVEVNKLSPSVSSNDKSRGHMTVQPDFLLIRNEVKMPNFDGRSRLDGFLFADIPAVNSLQSVLTFCSRAAVQGQLHRLNRQLGEDAFPVVKQHFASSHRSLMYGYTFPAVVKVGSAHAGVGKMKINDHHQMSDFRSVLAMMPDEHCFVEPFIAGEADLRIQKIGNHYRAFRRIDVSGEWKTNTGTSILDMVECEDRWRLWADAAAEMFGGLDILTVDAMVEQGTGKEYILEVNGTSSGLAPDYAEEDNKHIRDLVLDRMNQCLCF